MTSSGAFGRLRRDIGCLWPALGVAAGVIAVLLLLGVGTTVAAGVGVTLGRGIRMTAGGAACCAT